MLAWRHVISDVVWNEYLAKMMVTDVERGNNGFSATASIFPSATTNQFEFTFCDFHIFPHRIGFGKAKP